MSNARVLSAADREFFSDVVKIVFTNPFSRTRAELDARVGGASISEPDPVRRSKLMRAVFSRIDALDQEQPLRLDEFRGKDREIVQYTCLFEIYHRFKEEFDRLIAEQMRRGEESVPVPFADDALLQLGKRGFPKDEALRNFALYYQLRRGFFFIDRLLGSSACMRELRLNLWNNIFTSDIHWYNRHLWNRMEDFSTLLLGETGTGKGTAATAIGQSGFIPYDETKGRFRESFTKVLVSLNLSQYPAALIESELFGHKKGSFTGATEDHPGVFASCSPSGSIFLDEIGEVDDPIQIKLLCVLQERWFSPVGSHEKMRFHGRVIAATNRTLGELRSERTRDDAKHFRDDFYYRLCSDVIVMPPLRQRIAEDGEEIVTLVDHTLRRLLDDEAPDVLEMVLECIQKDLGGDYSWPGNVRELEQCVRRILIRRHYEGDADAAQATDLRGRLQAAVDSEDMDAAALLEAYCALLYQRHGSYEQVSKKTKLDRRTVKKYIESWNEREE